MRDQNLTDYLKMYVWSELLHERERLDNCANVCERSVEFVNAKFKNNLFV